MPKKKPKPPKPSKTEAESCGPKYRVWKLDAALKASVAAKRDAKGQTTREFVSTAIEQGLAGLVEGLTALGVTADSDEESVSVRLPMLESSLASLRQASAKSGLSQSALLVACLRQAVRRRRRRR